jgi:hypothetical protein
MAQMTIQYMSFGPCHPTVVPSGHLPIVHRWCIVAVLVVDPEENEVKTMKERKKKLTNGGVEIQSFYSRLSALMGTRSEMR